MALFYGLLVLPFLLAARPLITTLAHTSLGHQPFNRRERSSPVTRSIVAVFLMLFASRSIVRQAPRLKQLRELRPCYVTRIPLEGTPKAPSPRVEVVEIEQVWFLLRQLICVERI